MAVHARSQRLLRDVLHLIGRHHPWAKSACAGEVLAGCKLRRVALVVTYRAVVEQA
jgi:hypothetical protein